MHRFRKNAEVNGQVPISSDDISYDDISTPDTSTGCSTSFDSADYTQVSVGSGDTDQNTGDANDKPWMKHGNDDNVNGGDSQYGNTAAMSTGNFLIAIIAIVVVIIAAVIYFHDDTAKSRNNSTSDSYSSHSSQESKKYEDQEKKQNIIEEAGDAYRDISDQDLKVTDALDTLTLNSGSSGNSKEVTQDEVDKLKTEMAKMSKPIDAFKKTRAYRKYSSVRKAYKGYTEANKDYQDTLNHFADSVIAYTKAKKSCNEANDWSNMDSDAASYAAGKQKTITTCKSAAQDITNSKDEPIRQYAADANKRMGDAQKQLDGIKALGSADGIFGNETKFQSFENMSRKLDADLNPAMKFGDQNPVYKELTDARPGKTMLNVNSAIYDIDK